MNQSDFARNFQSSWFAMPFMHLARYIPKADSTKLLAGQVHTGIISDTISPDALVPCTKPRFADNGRSFTVRVVLPARDSTFGTGYAYGTIPDIPWEADFDESPQCVVKTPCIGMLPDAKGLTYVDVAPIRSTARGFCIVNCETTRITRASKHLFSAERADGLTREGYWFVFNAEYPTVREALDLLNSGDRLGVPLTKYLGLHAVENKKYPVLAYKNRLCVGSIHDPTTIKLYPDITAQCERYIMKQYPFFTFIK